jgi:hypothetical protein
MGKSALIFGKLRKIVQNLLSVHIGNRSCLFDRIPSQLMVCATGQDQGNDRDSDMPKPHVVLPGYGLLLGSGVAVMVFRREMPQVIGPIITGVKTYMIALMGDHRSRWL